MRSERTGNARPLRGSRAPRGAWGVGLLVSVLAGVLATAPAVHAQEAPPEVAVRERNDTVKSLLDAADDSISAQTREKLKDVINGLMDFRELSRRALGPHWEARTAKERDEFVEVFRELVRNSSVQKLELYQVDSTTYRPAEIDGDEARLVTVAHDGGGSAEIVYLMHRVDGEWKAYDVIIDGSSTLRTYRDSFRREIDATSYTAMYDRLQERLNRDRGGSGR